MFYTEKNAKEWERKMYIYKQELFNMDYDAIDIGRMVGEAIPNGEINEDLSKAIFEKLNAIHDGIQEALTKATGEIK